MGTSTTADIPRAADGPAMSSLSASDESAVAREPSPVTCGEEGKPLETTRGLVIY